MRRLTCARLLAPLAAVTLLPALLLSAPAADAATQPGPFTVTAVATLPEFPDPTTGGVLPQIRGAVADAAGDGIAGLRMSLTYTDADHPTPQSDGASSTTATDGSFALQPTEPVRTGPQGLFESRLYTVVHAAGDAGYPALSSTPIHVGVPGSFTLLTQSGSFATPRNPYWAFQGQVSGPAGSIIEGQVQTPTGWRTVNTTTSQPYGTTGVNRFSIGFPGLAGGSQTVRAVRVADAYQDEVDTAAVRVTYTWSHLAGNPSRFAFATLSPAKQPVRFSPCTPIPWGINLDGAPPGALRLVEQAFVQAGHYSGYHFRYVGTTNERPGTRDASQRASSGKGPAILVKWVRANGETDLARNLHNVAGVGGSVLVKKPGQPTRLAGGSLLLIQKPGGVDLPMDFGPESWGPEVLHEIGSVLGLRMVPDTRQIMFTRVGLATRYGAGDVNGLARLGKTPGC